MTQTVLVASALARVLSNGTERFSHTTKAARRILREDENGVRVQRDSFPRAVAADRPPRRRLVRVGGEEAALPQEAVERRGGGDQCEAEHIAAQSRAAVAAEAAQRHQIDGHGAADLAMDHDPAMLARRRDVHEAALRKPTLLIPFLLVLFRIAKHLERGIVDRRHVLCGPLEVVHIPGADDRLHDARQLGLRVARIPDTEHERGRRQPRDGGGVARVEKDGEGGVGLFCQRRGADESIAQPVPGPENGDGPAPVVPVGDRHLRHQGGVWLFLEHRLHAIGLGPHAVDGGDPGAVGKRVDVVADVRIGRRENHGIAAFHRQQGLPQRQRDGAGGVVGAALGKIRVEFGHDGGVSSMTSVMQRA